MCFHRLPSIQRESKIVMCIEKVAQRFHLSHHICLEEKPKATNCIDLRTISLIAQPAEAKFLRRRIERKIEDVLGENQFQFRREG